MSDKLIFIIPVITIFLFFVNIFYKGNNVQSCLLFILSMLPFMDLKITKEAWGGFKTFDFISFYCLVFLLKDFITINLKSRNNFYFLLFVALSIIILVGGLTSQFPDRTYVNLIKTFPIFIFGRFLLTECIKDPSFHVRAINALKIAVIVDLVFLFAQMVVGLGFTFYPQLGPNTIDPVYKIIRYPGVFFDSQAHGQFLAMGSFLFLYIEENASRRRTMLNYLTFVLCVIGISVAGSRAAFGGFIVGSVIVFFMAAKQYRLYGSILIMGGIAVYAIVSPQVGVLDRAGNLSEDYLFRRSIWKEAFEISKDHPYLGIGSGNYQNYVIRHSQDQYLEMEDGVFVYFDQPENGYLKIMVELGFIGFGIFLLFVIIPLFKGFILYLKNIIDNRVAFIMASLVSWLVAFNTVYSIYDNRLLIMVACMAVLIISYPTKEYFNDELALQREF
jgi:O-antigen ligase